MQNDAPLVSPGWYEAGEPGQQRWWSGVAWTDQVRASPYSEKWDRRGWGANPEVMVALAVIAFIVFLMLQFIVVNFLLSGDLLRGGFGFVITLGLPALAIIAIMSARIGFRRKALGRPAAGER